VLAAALLGCGSDPAEDCNAFPRAGKSTRTEVVVNEVFARSAAALPDWIELFNRGDASMDVGCWSVIDQSALHEPYLIPPGTVIPPAGFLVIRRDDTGGSGFTFGFGTNDTAILRDSEGLVADQTSWEGEQAPPDKTWGRRPDGTGAFHTLATPSEGAPNG